MLPSILVLLLSLLAGGLQIGMALSLQDNLFADVSTACPNGAATTYQTAIDLQIAASSLNDFQPDYLQVEIVVPTFTTSQLGDTQTIIVSLLTSDTSDLSSGSPTTLAVFPTFTGASGAGAAGATYYVRLPTTCKKYLGVKVVKTGASNASTANITTKLKF